MYIVQHTPIYIVQLTPMCIYSAGPPSPQIQQDPGPEDLTLLSHGTFWVSWTMYTLLKVSILSIDEKDKITTIVSAKKPEEAQPSLISLPRLIPLGITAKHPVDTPKST